MALLVTVKHLTTIKGSPYFQRRIPKRLLQHPAIKSTHYKVRLPVDPADELALLSALNRANEAFLVYVETLTNANLEALSELDLQRRAVLKLNLAARPSGELKKWHLLETVPPTISRVFNRRR